MSSRPPPFPQPFAVPVSTNPVPRSTRTGHASYAAPNPATHTVHPPSMPVPSPSVPPFPQPPVRPPAHPYGHSAAHPPASHPPAFPIPFSPPAQAPAPPVQTPHTIQRTAKIPTTSPGRTAHPNLHSVHNPHPVPLPGMSGAAQFSAEGWGHQDNRAGGTFEQRPSVLRHPEGSGTYPGTQANPLSGQPQPSRHTAPRPKAPQPTTEHCRLCQRSIQRDVAKSLNGFCSEEHMWRAINANTAILCPTCGGRACRPGRRYCGDTCGRG